jgi:hypothetical protein
MTAFLWRFAIFVAAKDGSDLLWGLRFLVGLEELTLSADLIEDL